MTTADRHTDVDPATPGGHREQANYADRDSADRDSADRGMSGYDAAPTDERADPTDEDRPRTGAQRLDAQDSDLRGVSDPTLTDAAAATPATTPATGTDPVRTEDTYASRHPESPEQGAGTAAGDGTPAAATSGIGDRQLERLVPSQRVQEYTTRWDAVKGEFVDEPRQAVAKADALVGELLDELDQLFRKQRNDLEQGLKADETSTEDLRLALRRYRSFFDRLLAL